MNKIFVIILLFTIVVGSAIGGYFIFREPEIQLPPPPSQKIEVPSLSPQDRQFIEDMKQAELEEKIQREKKEASIPLFQEAIKSSDLTICEKIEISEIQSNCINQVTLSLAVKTQDIEICSTLSGSLIGSCQDMINLRVSEKLSASGETLDTARSTCQKIRDKSIKARCIRQLDAIDFIEKANSEEGVTSKDCQEITDPLVKKACGDKVINQNDYLLLSESIKKNNLTACEKIVDTDLKNRCKDGVYHVQAKNEGSLSLCERIVKEDTKNRCKKDVTTARNRLIYTEAINTENSELCATISDETLKNGCLDRARIKKVIASGDIAQCDVLLDASLRTSCIQSIELRLAK